MGRLGSWLEAAVLGRAVDLVTEDPETSRSRNLFKFINQPISVM